MITYLKCAILTKEGKKLYVSAYDNSRYDLYYELSGNIENAIVFNGQDSGGNPNSDNDIYPKPINYIPFMSLRDTLKRKEFNSLKDCKVIIEEYSAKDGCFVGNRNVPKFNKKYKGIKNKRIKIKDNVNNMTVYAEKLLGH